MLFVLPASEPTRSTAPFFTERCPAGFPSPAANYTEDELDLNTYCIRRPSATYFVRAIGDSMLREHVRSGTGLIIGVGMGPTKTLAKSAQWASKE